MRKAALTLLSLLSLAVAWAQPQASYPDPAFPAQIADDSRLLRAYDRGAGFLAQNITSTDMTIPLVDATVFTGARDFSVTIEDERIKICSVTGSVLVVCPDGRGFSGSQAAPHLAGASVRATDTAWHHNALASEIKAIEQALGPNLSNVMSAVPGSGVVKIVNGTPTLVPGAASECVKVNGEPGACIYGNEVYENPSWIGSLDKAKVGLSNVENIALSTWQGSTNLTTIGPLASYLKAPKQLSFTIWDQDASVPATTIRGIWRAELGPVTLTMISCMADVTGSTIQIVRNGSTNMLSSNLACGSNSWLGTASFSNPMLSAGDDLGLRVISGSAKRINVSVRYMQQ